MRVLTVLQPFAQLIVRGVKEWDVRKWSSDYSGRIAIYAAAAAPTNQLIADAKRDDEMAWTLDEQGWHTRDDLMRLPRSAVIGTVQLVGVRRADMFRDEPPLCGKVARSDFLWKLADPIEIEPIFGIAGQLKLWTLPEDVAQAVADAEARARAFIAANPPVDPGSLPCDMEYFEDLTVAEFDALPPAEWHRRVNEKLASMTDMDRDHEDAIEQDQHFEEARQEKADRAAGIVRVPEPVEIPAWYKTTPPDRHGRAFASKEFDALLARTIAQYLAQHKVRRSGSRTEVRVDHRLPDLARLFAGREWVGLAEFEAVIRDSLWVHGGADLDYDHDDDDENEGGPHADPYRDFSGKEEMEAQGRYVRLPDGSTAKVGTTDDLPAKRRKR